MPATTPAVGTDCSLTLTGPKREAVGRYISQLGPELEREYGKQRHYSPEQVRRTIGQQGLSVDYACFAYCLYCSPADFAHLHAAAGESCDYGAMRALVDETFFTGVTSLAFAGGGEAIAGGADLAGGVDLLGELAEGAGAAAEGAGAVAEGIGSVVGAILGGISL